MGIGGWQDLRVLNDEQWKPFAWAEKRTFLFGDSKAEPLQQNKKFELKVKGFTRSYNMWWNLN